MIGFGSILLKKSVAERRKIPKPNAGKNSEKPNPEIAQEIGTVYYWGKRTTPKINRIRLEMGSLTSPPGSWGSKFGVPRKLRVIYRGYRVIPTWRPTRMTICQVG